MRLQRPRRQQEQREPPGPADGGREFSSSWRRRRTATSLAQSSSSRSFFSVSSESVLIICLLLVLVLALLPVDCLDAGTATATATAGGSGTGTTAAASSKQQKKMRTYRKRHLDYLDAETVTYYLELPEIVAASIAVDDDDDDDPHPSSLLPEYDVAVLFYAPWDTNSVRLAGTWDKIATILKAGTKQSKLVMGVFDCEYDYDHSTACTEAGITHYPTILYFQLGDPKLPGTRKKSKSRPPRHLTKFKGNWQYGDAILDWLKTMRGLSQWHRAGWGSKLRQLLLPFGGGRRKNRKPKGLPVGVPTAGMAAAAAVGGGGAAAAASSQADQMALAKAIDEKEAMKEVAVRSSVLIETLLFPHTMPYADPLHPTPQELSYVRSDGTGDSNKTYTDAFHLLNATGGWMSGSTGNGGGDDDNAVLRTCVQDIALDYCDRYKLGATERYLLEQQALGNVAKNDWSQLQAGLRSYLEEGEPYCLLLEDCVLSKFAADQCRPPACPFVDPTACRYLTACFTETIRKDYRKALGLGDGKKAASAAAAATAGGGLFGGTAPQGRKAADDKVKEEETKKKVGGGFWGAKKDY